MQLCLHAGLRERKEQEDGVAKERTQFVFRFDVSDWKVRLDVGRSVGVVIVDPLSVLMPVAMTSLFVAEIEGGCVRRRRDHAPGLSFCFVHT